MTLLQQKKADPILLTGWCLLALSFTIFCWPLIFSVENEQDFGIFMMNFAISVIYFFFSRFYPCRFRQENLVHYRMIRLMLFLISAYSLNREFEVFATSPAWLSITLVIVCLNYLSSVFFEDLPAWWQHTMFFLYGVSLVLFLYLSIYLLPLYILSVFAMLAIGISVHTFIPLFFIFATIRLAMNLARTSMNYWKSLMAGSMATTIACILFIFTWSNRVNQLNGLYTASITQAENSLPSWVQVAQHTPQGMMTEKVLKNDLTYITDPLTDGLLWSMPRRNFGDEPQVHDPFVVMGNAFSATLKVPQNDRIKILESQYNARHQALERLWSGDHLRTSMVTTHIKVWPEMHLAYSEKIITVCNEKIRTGWRDMKEAIYTFHLPEGGVVTSLSLWIDGKEEKAILTSKGKADTAYKTIVGYERRDPCALHWQEGNTVSIRVFPVVPGNCRTFKIGITAPLRKDDGQLAYDNIYFEGPDATSAKEKVEVEMMTVPKSFIRHATYSSQDSRTFTTSRNYKPVWTAYFEDLNLKPANFSFNGNTYSIIPYQKNRIPSIITDVYLDINKAWTRDEINKVMEATKGKRIWVYEGKMQLLTTSNQEKLFTSLRQLQFSLFPFYEIDDREHALVISKSGGYSPNIQDLEGSLFLQKLRKGAAGESRIRLFHIGNVLSPYLRSLQEFRLFDFEYGSLQLLQHLMEKGMFVRETESNDEVIIHTADMVIRKTKGNIVSNAPDHLMRLFAYNHIIQQLGTNGLTKTGEDAQYVAEAQEAYVVSPVSSLVVLEKKSDYERFGISDNDASLKNASMNNKGAVPEPATWALIVVLAAGFFFFLVKWKFL